MKAVAVKIPALVTPAGEWMAVGWGRPGEFDEAACLKTLQDGLEYPGPDSDLRLVWVTVDLPLPVPSEATAAAAVTP